MNTGRSLSPLVILWFLLLAFSASYIVYTVSTSTPFYSNIMELLPEDERNPALNTLTRTMAGSFENRLLILLQAENNSESLKQARQLQTKLEALTGVKAGQTDSRWMTILKEAYQPYLSILLTDASRQRLREMSPKQLAERQLQQLLSPVAVPRLYSFQEDPFALGSEWVNQAAGGLDVELVEGLPTVVSDGKRWIIIAAELAASPFDVKLQQRITSLVSQQQVQYPDTQLLTSGLVFHAAAGTRQAKQEISTVGAGSLLGIVALVLLIFRSASPLLLVLIVLSGGCLIALTVSLLVFERIHLITLVFGSTLLGVSVDYAFHFLVKARRYNSGARAISAVRSALAVGALTSIFAYLLQWLAPFPGLQQMAIFSASGLLGAWFTLLCCSHFYLSGQQANDSQTENTPKQSFQWAATCLDQFCRILTIRHFSIIALLVIVALGAMVIISIKGSNDSVASLNTSGQDLLVSEGRVQSLMKYPSGQQFFWVKAESQQQLLVELESLYDTLRQQLPDTNMRGVNEYVPSLQRQAENAALLSDKLYTENAALEKLCELLSMDCEGQRKTLAQSSISLSVHVFSDSTLNSLIPPVIYQDGVWHSALSLSLEGVDRGLLKRLASERSSVVWVDQGENLTSLLSQYRKTVSTILVVTLIVLAVVMLSRYRQQAWRMLLPLYFSLLVALACAALGGGITLFHMAALLLVLGIGVDTGVFYLEVGLQPDSWLAAGLASITSMLAFGLLSLSEVPVLQQFGVVVLSGILCCWLVTPMFFIPRFHTPLNSNNGNSKDSL